ncbi:MAG: hypothetical protein LVQ97_01275 [Candidatus Micrarchaeales archaeon]|jgi:hypothetical protein|uniref:Uncharacterized protein n=1 Tax=Candidatus Micrarchaeum acidiphilum ARMAN-2 TaxID=425595 RepID=C7DHX9_MICA2|nr:MAG: hypothetical protein UNLARM2_0673 [Candidatus Micrarchaeum acidiphilum ARMAN-2]MCW6160800.1 hypothetical protein [Candidatus Micrarchaeales archaeon]
MEGLKFLDSRDSLAREKVEKVEHFSAQGSRDGARVSYIFNINLAKSGDSKQDELLHGIISSIFNHTSDLRNGELDWKAYLLDDRKSVFASIRIDVPTSYAKKNEQEIVASLCKYCDAFEKQLSAAVGKAIFRSFRR